MGFLQASETLRSEFFSLHNTTKHNPRTEQTYQQLVKSLGFLEIQAAVYSTELDIRPLLLSLVHNRRAGLNKFVIIYMYIFGTHLYALCSVQLYIQLYIHAEPCLKILKNLIVINCTNFGTQLRRIQLELFCFESVQILVHNQSAEPHFMKCQAFLISVFFYTRTLILNNQSSQSLYMLIALNIAILPSSQELSSYCFKLTATKLINLGYFWMGSSIALMNHQLNEVMYQIPVHPAAIN